MEIYAVYREAAKPMEQPLYVTTSFDMARRKGKTYPAPVKIVSRSLDLGYGVAQVNLSGQLKQVTINRQHAYIPDKLYIIEEQREGSQ